MIKPTVGRVVWYRPSKGDGFLTLIDERSPLAAIISHVWSDTCVNLMVICPNGVSYSRTTVYLSQDDDACQTAPYCEWMPYQKGQAAKTEALESANVATLGGVKDKLTAEIDAATDHQLRLECLRQASRFVGEDDGRAMKISRDFYSWVTGVASERAPIVLNDDEMEDLGGGLYRRK